MNRKTENTSPRDTGERWNVSTKPGGSRSQSHEKENSKNGSGISGPLALNSRTRSRTKSRKSPSDSGCGNAINNDTTKKHDVPATYKRSRIAKPSTTSNRSSNPDCQKDLKPALLSTSTKKTRQSPSPPAPSQAHLQDHNKCSNNNSKESVDDKNETVNVMKNGKSSRLLINNKRLENKRLAQPQSQTRSSSNNNTDEDKPKRPLNPAKKTKSPPVIQSSKLKYTTTATEIKRTTRKPIGLGLTTVSEKQKFQHLQDALAKTEDQICGLQTENQKLQDLLKHKETEYLHEEQFMKMKIDLCEKKLREFKIDPDDICQVDPYIGEDGIVDQELDEVKKWTEVFNHYADTTDFFLKSFKETQDEIVQQLQTMSEDFETFTEDTKQYHYPVLMDHH